MRLANFRTGTYEVESLTGRDYPVVTCRPVLLDSGIVQLQMHSACPYCGDRHLHGGGEWRQGVHISGERAASPADVSAWKAAQTPETLAAIGGHRVPHCPEPFRDNPGYILRVDPELVDTRLKRYARGPHTRIMWRARQRRARHG